jgi:methionyl-tRNA formyltransferase
MIVEALATLPHLSAEPQPDSGVTYAAKIDKAEARVDWSRPAAEVVHQINGLSPFPGAWCAVNGERLKLLRAETIPGTGASEALLPGTVVQGFEIACGAGALRVLEAQREGKKPMPAAEVLKGLSLPDRLGA